MEATRTIVRALFAFFICVFVVVSSHGWLKSHWPGHEVLAKLVAEGSGLLTFALLLTVLAHRRVGLAYPFSFVMQRPFRSKGEMLGDAAMSILFGMSCLLLVTALKTTLQMCCPVFVELGWLKALSAGDDGPRIAELGVSAWFDLLTAFLIGATFEEFVFRGILFGYLWRNHSLWLAIAFSVLLFGVFHGTSKFIWTALDGSLYLALYMVTQRLSSSIAAHCAHNVFVYLKAASGLTVSFVPVAGSIAPALLGWSGAGFVAACLYLGVRRRFAVACC